MKHKNYYWLLPGLLVLLAACQSRPGFVNHPEPDLSVAFDVFDDAGCPQDEYGSRRCTDYSPLRALGCDEIREPSRLLGGLNPSYPIAVCQIQFMPGQMGEELQAEIDQGLYFYNTGGLFSSYVRYVILRDGEYHLIRSENEFREIYAPIENSEEALSYVLASKRLAAYYGLEYNPAFTYEVDTIEDTHVTSEPDGYKVHLFYYELFGCGPHWTSEVEMHVTPDGNIQEISQRQIFRDPNEDGLCVD